MNPKRPGWIKPGRAMDFDGSTLYSYEDQKAFDGSRQFTFVFAIFVFLQIFNMINARKINDEYNICEGICGNILFIGVWLSIVIVQVLVTQFSGKVFKCNKYGLDLVQWLMVVGISILVIPLDIVAKFVPDTCCPCFAIKVEDEDDDDDEEEAEAEAKAGAAAAGPAEGVQKDMAPPPTKN
jgi:magnesium-transporting ATPase (P-type)